MADPDGITVATRVKLDECAFYGGSGALAGFSAIVQVTVDAKQVWRWDGSYAITK